MIRITELRLPINHPPEAVEEAILKRLDISAKVEPNKYIDNGSYLYTW
jgi:hypothetical protein